MAKRTGSRPTQGSDVLAAVEAHLQAEYGTGRAFPPDITLAVFRYVRRDAYLWALYEAATADADGNPVDAHRSALNRRIGKVVKRTLGARVVGRSKVLDPDQAPIGSFALLAPVDP